MDLGAPLTPYQIDVYDTIVFFILGIPSLILSCILIIGFLKHKKLRESPGDIILMISIGGLFLSCHWVLTGLFSGHIFDDLSNNDYFCLSNAVVSVFCGSMIYLYNIAFCVYLMASLRNVLKASIVPRKILHFTSISLSAGYVALCSFTNSLGKSIYGTCSIKYEPSDSALSNPIKYLGLVIVYSVISCWSYFYIRARQPKVPNTNKRARRAKVFLNHYLKFVILNSFIWLVIGLSYLLGMIYRPDDDPESDVTLVAHIVASFGNISKMLYIFIVLLIRLTDPLIARTMKKVVFFCLKRKLDSFAVRSDWGAEVESLAPIGPRGTRVPTFRLTDDNVVPAENRGKRVPTYRLDAQESVAHTENRANRVHTYKLEGLDASDNIQEALLDDSHSSELVHSGELHGGIENYANVIANELKIQTTMTIISCVLHSYKKVIEEDEKIGLTQIFRTSDRLRQSKKFEVSDQLISGHWSRVSDKHLQPLDGSFTFHCPVLFHHILKKDSGFVNIEESLNIESNYNAIRAASGADGGRSGEFFFFSSDNKLIIKTMSEKELIKMLQILPNYLQHLEQNPHSLITRIYGVFSYRREFEANSEHFLLMRNAAGVTSEFISRKYDLKGSTVDREVLLGQEMPDKALLVDYRTLKDIDFLKYEKKLNIKEELRIALVASLDCDVEFLRSLNLMDYSLMVIILNRKEILSVFGHVPKSACYNQLCSFEDDADPNWFYNIAIIDFLQEYNCRKLLENRFKRFKAAVFRCRWNLDISAQPTDKYAKRFKNFIRKIIQ